MEGLFKYESYEIGYAKLSEKDCIQEIPALSLSFSLSLSEEVVVENKHLLQKSTCSE